MEREGRWYLAERHASVWILDGGNATIWVESNVWLNFEVGKLAKLGLVWNIQLFEENGNFPWIGT